MKKSLTITSWLLLLSLPILSASNSTQSLAASSSPARCQIESADENEYSPEQIKTIAERITVRVRGSNSGASGTLVAKEGNSYLVLTNNHVLDRIQPGEINIQTIDGKIHRGRILDKSKLVNQKQFAQYDLAILEFTSGENYCLPIDVANQQVKEGTAVLASGYSAQTGKFTFEQGIVKKIQREPTLAEGYEIGYDSKVEQGMSGGPIIDLQGLLLGINGQSAFPIVSNYVYADGTEPKEAQIEEIRRLSWGIPILPILAQIKGEYLTAYSLPLPDVITSVPQSPLPEWIRRIEEKVKQFTVRIDINRGGNGSGVIIAKEGNTYTVLTAAHVLEDNNNREYTIVTGDEKKHPIDRKSIKLEEGVDLAVVKFQSRENYPIATLADYPTTNYQYTYTAGYPQIGDKSPWRFTLGWIYSKEQGLFVSTQSDFKTIASGLQGSVAAVSLTGGYELVYTNITLGGMSGGPVLDAQGRVIGIHGRAEGQVAIDEKTGDKGGNRGSQVQLGFSLGVPTSTFLAISPRLNTQAQQVEKTAARELEPKEIESIKQAILSVDVSQGNATASQWIERGNQLWRLGRYTEAVTAFDNAIKQKPAFIHLAYYGKGLSLRDDGKYKDAVMALKQSVSAKPDFVPGWSTLSIASRGLGNLEDAEKAINEAIRLEPKNPNLYNEKYAILSGLKRYREAIDAINEVIRINPNFAYAYNNRGVARYDLGDKQGAIGDFNQAIQINPNYAHAYNNRGVARYNLGDKQGAIVDYNQAIQINPNYADAYYNRGVARYNLGDKQGAIVDYNQAIQINPNYAIAYYNRGNARYDLGDKQGAIVDYNQAIQINPNYAIAYNNRGVARYNLGDKQGAIVDYNQAIQINPNDADAYYNRGVARYNLGDKQGAISDLQTAAQLFQQQGNEESYQRALNIISQLR